MRYLVQRSVNAISSAFDRFLFESCQPTICSVIRIAAGVLLAIYTYAWWLDGTRWFSDDGVLRLATSRKIYNGEYITLLSQLPSTVEIVQGGLILLMVQSGLLLLGVWSRFQAVSIFILLTSFQHRNVLIVDGQDTVMRWLVFSMIFMPLDHKWSLWRAIAGTPSRATQANAWALRVLQVEWTGIYFSSAFMKAGGSTWRDGTALYYVARTDDVFGRFWVPDLFFETLWILRLCTWSVLVVEIFIPIGLWFPRLRIFALIAAFALHLSIEYSMNLFLFQWLMMTSLLSFVGVKKSEPKQDDKNSLLSLQSNSSAVQKATEDAKG